MKPRSWAEVKDRGRDRALVAVHADELSLALSVAALMVDEGRRAVDVRGRFSVVLTGGSTPVPVYRFLAASPLRELMPWARTEVFWTDERCVGPDDPRSNERMVRETLLDHVPVRAENVHPIRCGSRVNSEAGKEKRSGAIAAATVAEAGADRYDALLTSLFAAGDGSGAIPSPGRGGTEERTLDLVLLGLGKDGHTASLFPGTSALQEERAAAAVFVGAVANAGTTAGEEDLWRVTITPALINRAATVVFLASGSTKASIVRDTLQGSYDPARLPAQSVDPAGVARWQLDEEAAGLLDATVRRS